MPQVIWTKLLGTSSYDWVSSLTTGSDGAIYVAGFTGSNLDGQTNSGGSDTFVVKLNANEAPVITSAATATFAENGTGTVYTVTATDVDAGTNLTYSLSGTEFQILPALLPPPSQKTVQEQFTPSQLRM